MGQRASDTTTITASPDAVYAVVADLDAYTEWAEDIQSVEVLERDADGLPLRAVFRVDARVAEISYTLEYTHERPGRMSWTLLEGDMVTQLDGQYELTDLDGATRVTYSLEVDLSLPLPGFMLKRGARTILDTGLRGLKKRVEGA